MRAQLPFESVCIGTLRKATSLVAGEPKPQPSVDRGAESKMNGKGFGCGGLQAEWTDAVGS